jgi:hypothetical protein
MMLFRRNGGWLGLWLCLLSVLCFAGPVDVAFAATKVEVVKTDLKPLIRVAGASPSLAPAQEPIKLNMSDVLFQFRPMPKGSAMCGYSILGNHLSRDDPKVEWDI